jgi:DNA-binding response OmpR family regulator
MIAIVSPVPRERAAFAALCTSRGWPTIECDSVRTLTLLLGRTSPRVVLTRHKLADGFSDDVMTALRAGKTATSTRIIVVMGAGSTSALEARQIALGADCVQRDPVRTDVLVEYLTKYYTAAEVSHRSRRTGAKTLRFAGAMLHVDERTLKHSAKAATLTPRECDLLRMLAQSPGEVLSYETLYSEILGRRFHGDTSNMRVLLGKLAGSTARLGIALRRWVEVIPKAGYRYHRRPKPARRRSSIAKKAPTST